MKGDFNMKNTTCRVVILENVNSNLIEQTILILKNSAKDEDSQLIREAEKIVEKYMGKKKKEREEKKPPMAVILSICAAIISLSALIITFFI